MQFGDKYDLSISGDWNGIDDCQLKGLRKKAEPKLTLPRLLSLTHSHPRPSIKSRIIFASITVASPPTKSGGLS